MDKKLQQLIDQEMDKAHERELMSEWLKLLLNEVDNQLTAAEQLPEPRDSD